MKRLTVVRHAKSDWSLPDQQDWDRVLNKRGQRDAPEMARRLRARKLRPDRILTSPAVRALTTATIMAHELKVNAAHVLQDERLYLASAPDMLAVVREKGHDATHLMVFGHNPGITEFVNQLSAGEQIDNMPTCAIYTLQFAIAAWSELEWSSGIDADFDYPKRSS